MADDINEPYATKRGDRVYEWRRDLMPYVFGVHPEDMTGLNWGQQQMLPNWEPIDMSDAKAVAHALAYLHQLHAINATTAVRVPNPYDGHLTYPAYPAYAKVFLINGQWSWQGEGLAIVSLSFDRPLIGHFALCKHRKVEGPGANHIRGWHPGWCAKCGVNMDIDSGD